ncbi:tetratricopeptide repeat protein [Sphingomonas sp.]|uniref:tetratricopeptide repeat protein n=1 Tax=Sphingomonas sp. TaxID=28214 RepID=UPI002D1B52CD|nr:tetratricopeptide repeat protein [Sphingomonas sp.]HTG38045.1 tetratricopeptide repeat protein [Sphingomonas sp.]
MNRLFAVLMLSGTAMLAQPVAAQTVVEARVDRLEREMRAVQRKVFPGGAGQLIEPQITAPQSSPSTPGAPATSAVADLNARVSSLESQLSSLTGQIEQNQYQLRQLEQAFEAYKRSTDAKLAAPVAAAAPGTGTALAASGDTRMAAPPRIDAPAAAEPAAAGRVAGVERPSTGDAGEDDYTYGYRLWAAKAYPQAAAVLKKVVADHPNHRRASFAQNLLGRAYLDDGKPSLASIAFYDNYKKMPDGERAPDSLYYLGQALIQLKKPADACKVYDELTDVYSGRISASMSADIAQARTAAKCG